MHATLNATRDRLASVIAQLKQLPNDEPFWTNGNNWSFPGLTRIELIEETQSLISEIENRGLDEIAPDDDRRLSDYQRRLDFLKNNTIPNLWGNAGLGVPAFMLTLTGLRRAVIPALSAPEDDRAEAAVALRRVLKSVRAMEATVKGLAPRTESIETKVERIEKASDAADQLPTDLESLAEARAGIKTLLDQATKDRNHVGELREQADDLDEKLRASATDAEAVLQRCETAYSAATSVGLAAAFTERSDKLSSSMGFWVFGLVAALASGAYFGSTRIEALSRLLTSNNVSPAMIVTSLALSIFSVAAPVWFAWLATKQIGQRFRLAEDYAYKATISRAYEGFRRETSRFDKDMEARLLISALDRLDELPLRLVETETHGSPWHELARSPLVSEAMKLGPQFGDGVKDLAAKTIEAVSRSKTKPLEGSE